ncbi:uncharacterized protein LOC132308372 [Cornus florida]|uniref:uncharacterized protein LOC132308372 n=1 Tax=Cornus florida TaxID=4283 RepID=UPI0028A222B9|nr:uncharacterized protein LOC132308372 [Cornus florida]
MHSMWVSLKENVNCRSKLTDVVHTTEKFVQNRSYTLENDTSDSELLRQMKRSSCNVNFGQNQTPKQFYELELGHPSRNVIEMIFRAASTNSTKHYMKIKKVLRVNNPIEMLEKFEKYRGAVKNKAYEQNKRHPRSMVDGNELLRFYGTTMTCCSRKLTNGVSELCRDPFCRVCRIIQSGFNTEYMRKNGIQLSTSSQDLSENMITNTKGQNIRRAVIVCRTIAGRILRVANMVDGENEEDYDSIGSGGLYSKLEYLIVQNPSAVLPCFVIVFN